MSASWSAEQREWLQAMGYDLLVPAGTSMIVDAPAVDAATAPATVPAAMIGAETRGAPQAPPRAPSPTAAPDLADPLLRALLRASRCDDLAQLARVAGDLAALRRSPAAKRALWPALRTLRVRSRR